MMHCMKRWQEEIRCDEGLTGYKTIERTCMLRHGHEGICKPTYEYEVTFMRGNGRDTKLSVWTAYGDVAAVEEAKRRFQWNYGYWPTDPSYVKKVGDGLYAEVE